MCGRQESVCKLVLYTYTKKEERYIMSKKEMMLKIKKNQSMEKMRRAIGWV